MCEVWRSVDGAVVDTADTLSCESFLKVCRG